MEDIIKGVITQRAQKSDVAVVSDVTESLFANIKFPGSDLIARNIQRGRDHGLPGYNEYREARGIHLIFASKLYIDDGRILLLNQHKCICLIYSVGKYVGCPKPAHGTLHHQKSRHICGPNCQPCTKLRATLTSFPLVWPKPVSKGLMLGQHSPALLVVR